MYAILHSPAYRQRYADFLKRDFPRIPFTSDVGLFRRLCALGQRLVACHLLEAPAPSAATARYPIKGANLAGAGYPKHVESPSGAGTASRVYVNDEQFFEGVPTEVWEYRVGGFQVCDKWLKDRRGRQLSYADLAHYQKVVAAIGETLRLMEEIDEAIPGWPLE